jgi:hypothetical protein
LGIWREFKGDESERSGDIEEQSWCAGKLAFGMAEFIAEFPTG